jgi:hypothetical protein
VKPLNALLVTLALTLGVLGACGSDDESDRGSPAAERADADQAPAAASGRPLSRKQFASRTGAVCGDLRVKIERLSQRYFAGGPATADEVSSFADKAARDLAQALTRLRRLSPPKADKAEIASVIQAAQRGVTRLQRAAEGPEEAKKLLRGGDPFARAQSLARRSGLRACGVGR